ncbi:alpha/beta hydrolase [Bdellovibrio bacteriovorus]|uniref:alpha/beta fold hydrolase n=1 Tax=Bdellovibrio bacteriovorus TaxID=959 RepID=UPI0021CEDB81|nr:alpha/beta hydrolase [Bdellovibrio bacteriovorus]UXR66081.1 alpha/beta hydrolase [Bdellovibrio bacteriovorus]
MSSALNTTEQFVSLQSATIYVKTWTPRNILKEIPIILLHDSLGCTDTWRDFPSLLAEKTGCVVVSYDRWGFGRSSARNELPSIHFISEEGKIHLPAILDALNIEKFLLFGHSVGGAMSVVTAGALPRRCHGIITESAQAFVEDRTREGISKAEVDFKDPKMMARLEKYHGDKARWVLDAWIKVWLSPNFSVWSLKDQLPLVQCPLMAIHGDKDEYGSFQFPEMIHRLTKGPSEMHILPDCGHVPHREKTEEILKLCSRFYGDL